ncbi:GNAT family N-acetyltransferase [Georgenia sp. TF02-10]|uniref:GNAT family N-acetyltransferase n=1 Tax=Georgenia sp. TF02-10 TaxID=2917725 RepID=UPI001FA80059|nr:GNAT family N-acetyltransferase [Georgenia sp. TF02-10]UNX56426.1 GNAT family N-acetyltransferase [Georgenia sp. TF02-10]
MTEPAARATEPAARIRPATVVDADAIADVHLRCWHETYGEAVPPEVYADRAARRPQQWQDLLADPGPTQTWVAVRGQEIVGFATAAAAGPGQVRPLQFQLLYVLAAEQGRGTGTHLLELAVGDAPCFLWVAETNTHAQRFYARHGFAPDGARQAGPAGWEVTEIRMVR